MRKSIVRTFVFYFIFILASTILEVVARLMLTRRSIARPNIHKAIEICYHICIVSSKSLSKIINVWWNQSECIRWHWKSSTVWMLPVGQGERNGHFFNIAFFFTFFHIFIFLFCIFAFSHNTFRKLFASNATCNWSMQLKWGQTIVIDPFPIRCHLNLFTNLKYINQKRFNSSSSVHLLASASKHWAPVLILKIHFCYF